MREPISSGYLNKTMTTVVGAFLVSAAISGCSGTQPKPADNNSTFPSLKEVNATAQALVTAEKKIQAGRVQAANEMGLQQMNALATQYALTQQHAVTMLQIQRIANAQIQYGTLPGDVVEDTLIPLLHTMKQNPENKKFIEDQGINIAVLEKKYADLITQITAQSCAKAIWGQQAVPAKIKRGADGNFISGTLLLDKYAEPHGPFFENPTEGVFDECVRVGNHIFSVYPGTGDQPKVVSFDKDKTLKARLKADLKKWRQAANGNSTNVAPELSGP